MFDPKKKESKAAAGENKEVKVAMNGVAWNQCPTFSSQYVTVDDLSRITLYGEQDKPIVQETASNGLLTTVVIEPR